MSQDNLELAKQVMAALTRRDLETVLALADPDVEWHAFFAELGEGGVYRGEDGARQWLRDLEDAWETISVEVHDGMAVGDIVLLVGCLRYRGKASGVESEASAGWMLKFRDGKVTRFRAFRDPAHAIEAVGATG